MTAIELYPQFDCRACTAEMQAERGCDADAPFPYWSDVMTGEERRRCPRRPVKDNPPWWNAIMGAYNHYQAGFLPHQGGMQDQAALFPVLMYRLALYFQKCEEAKRKAEQQASRSPGFSLLGKG